MGPYTGGLGLADGAVLRVLDLAQPGHRLAAAGLVDGSETLAVGLVERRNGDAHPGVSVVVRRDMGAARAAESPPGLTRVRVVPGRLASLPGPLESVEGNATHDIIGAPPRFLQSRQLQVWG